MEKEINIAIVGLGYWGPNLVRNFCQLDNVCVHSICDINEKRFASIIKNYPAIKTTTDFNEILNNPDISAVVIALPTALHYEYAKKALLAGKHVLVEKPMTSSSAQAEELIELAKKQQKILMVDHTFVYYGPVQKIKEIINSGELGKIYYFDSQRINLGLLRPDANVIWDLACHDISILNYLLEEKPVSVSAVGTCHFGNKKEEIAHLMIKYGTDLVSHVHVSWLSPVKIRQILIGGENKMIYFDDIQPSEKIKIYDRSVKMDLSKETPFDPVYRSGEIRIPVYNQKEALLLECEDFVECIKTGKQPLTNAESGLNVVKILEACDESLKEKGKEVSLN